MDVTPLSKRKVLEKRSYHFAGTCTIASQQAPGEPEQSKGACRHFVDAAVI